MAVAHSYCYELLPVRYSWMLLRVDSCETIPCLIVGAYERREVARYWLLLIVNSFKIIIGYKAHCGF